jgi:hypothetical protein
LSAVLESERNDIELSKGFDPQYFKVKDLDKNEAPSAEMPLLDTISLEKLLLNSDRYPSTMNSLIQIGFSVMPALCEVFISKRMR